MSRFDEKKGKGGPEPTRRLSGDTGAEVNPPFKKGDTVKLDEPKDESDFEREEGSMGGGNLGNLNEPPQPLPPTGGAKTQVYRPGEHLPPPREPEVGPFPPPPYKEETERPVVAWFVVIKGPGRGQSLEITHGRQSIGRDPDQDVALTFGDEGISRIEHAAVEYDPTTRVIYLFKRNGLVYLNGDRVGDGGERKLTSGDNIKLGAYSETILRFIPFCGPDFDWNEKQEKQA